MRRRVVRDLGTIIGVVVILAGVVGVNIYMRLEGLQQKFEAMRQAYEQEATSKGTELLDWSLLRKTKGSVRSGAKYAEDLKPKDGQPVHLMGFMTPIDQFREATHFMLLPLPIECYFCQAPPLRDVMLVKMAKGETVDLVEEPVMMTGRLKLNSGSGENFFYTLEDATRKTMGETHEKHYGKIHREEGATMGSQLLKVEDHPGQQPAMKKEQLLPPTEIPKPDKSESTPDQ